MRERINDQCEPSVATDSGAISSGISCVAPNMNDRSLAVWPDGKDDVLRSVLNSPAPSGRARRNTSLNGNCTTAATAEHAIPRRTARRPRAPVSDNAPANTAHMTGWRNTSPARLGSASPRRDPAPTRRHSMRSSPRHDMPIIENLGPSRVPTASECGAHGQRLRIQAMKKRRAAVRILLLLDDTSTIEPGKPVAGRLPARNRSLLRLDGDRSVVQQPNPWRETDVRSG